MEASEIEVKQNSDEALVLLASASWLYQRAKIILSIQFFLTVIAAFIFSGLLYYRPDAKVWTTFFSILIALADVIVLDQVQGHYRKLAAQVQELFDCELLSIAWNELKVGPKPDREDIIVSARKYRDKGKEYEHLKDWYPPSAGKVSIQLARSICQRANCWWDAGLRKKYAYTLRAILGLTIATVFLVSLGREDNLEQMILTVFAPVAPAILWTTRESRRQLDASKNLDTLRRHIEKTWSELLMQRKSKSEMDIDSRQVQDLIYDGRCKNPLIFDWINKQIRPSNQRTMNEKAEELVEEALSANGNIGK